MTRTALPLLLLLGAPLSAQELPLRQPIACTLGQDCYIQQFVDRDPGPGASDFTCGDLTYDGHKGTDFGLPTRADLARGVDVLAAAPGTVRGTRDGMADIAFGEPGAPDLEGRDCGNGVVISHGGGWETQYCHLAKGSVTVAQGQTVVAGQVIGEVGLSGRTQFPHLHLSVRRNGEVVDPFDPESAVTCGAPSEDTLWSDPMPWQPGGLLDLGFASAVPEYTAVKAGTADEALTTDSPAMVIFALFYGSQPGDIMRLEINGPDGTVFANDEVLERAQAMAFRAGGRRLRTEGWPAGDYTGTAQLIRSGASLDQLSAGFTLPANQ